MREYQAFSSNIYNVGQWNYGAERLSTHSCLAEYDASILSLSRYSVLREKLSKAQQLQPAQNILSPAETKTVCDYGHKMLS